MSDALETKKLCEYIWNTQQIVHPLEAVGWSIGCTRYVPGAMYLTNMFLMPTAGPYRHTKFYLSI